VGYYFDVVSPAGAMAQADWIARLARAGARDIGELDGDVRPRERFLWQGQRSGQHVMDLRARPRTECPEWGGELGWLRIRISWGTGEEIHDVILDFLDLTGIVGGRLWDGQTRRFITARTIAEDAQRFQSAAAKIVGMVGTVSSNEPGQKGP
jgi:hypothetical protein